VTERFFASPRRTERVSGGALAAALEPLGPLPDRSAAEPPDGLDVVEGDRVDAVAATAPQQPQPSRAASSSSMHFPRKGPGR
jgi:hypothetical protein